MRTAFPTVLHTSRSDIILRKLLPNDAQAMFQLIDRNRTHLSRRGDTTAQKYPDLASVLRSIEHPENPDRLRYGIWHGECFVGTVNLTPVGDGIAELGYWVGEEYGGRGYATLAAIALARSALSVFGFKIVLAETHEYNFASQVILWRAGFRFRKVLPKEPFKHRYLVFAREAA